MVSLGPEILVLLLALRSLGGSAPLDLVGLVDPADYFAARHVDATPRNLLALASASPTDAAGRFRQLLAIRRLADTADRLGEHRAAVRQALTRLAEEADGFARDHARIALARIDGKPTPVLHVVPPDSLREALAWFPADVTLAGALDVRAPPGRQAAAGAEAKRQAERVQALLLKSLPGQAREAVYQFAEAVGDCRLDRVAFGTALDPADSNKGRMYVRATGRMDHKRLAAYLREKLGPGVVVAERQGLRGEVITIFSPGASPPAWVLVGDHDLLLAGYVSDSVSCAGLADEVLAVRDGGRPNLLAGPLGKELRDVPGNAAGMLRGSVPRWMAAGIARSFLGAAPRQVAADLLPRESRDRPRPEAPGIEIRLRGTFDTEADAHRFADALRGQVREVRTALQGMSFSFQVLGAATVRKAVEEIEVRTDGPAVTARATLSERTIRVLLALLEAQLGARAGGGPNGR
jgi:hypothetical protein